MKSLILFFGLAACAWSAEPPLVETSFKLVRSDLLVVRLPMAKAVALQKELRNPKTAQVAVDKLIGLIEKNQAELVDWPTVITQSRNRAFSLNLREGKYPGEIDVPKVQPKTPTSEASVTLPAPTVPPDAALLPPARARDSSGATAGAEAKNAQSEIVSTPGGITSFTTRNVGVTLEIEPEIGPDGVSIAASLAPSHVSLTGYRRQTYEVNNQLATAYELPIFEELKVMTNLLFRSGEPRLVGFFNLREPKNTVELFILTLTIDETKYLAPKMAEAPALPIDPTQPQQPQQP